MLHLKLNNMPAVKKTFLHYQGDTFTAHFAFKNGDNTDKDVSGHSFKITLNKTGVQTPIVFNNGDFTRPSSHELLWSVAPTDQKAFTEGVYSYIIQVTYPDTTVRTWVQGTITVKDTPI